MYFLVSFYLLWFFRWFSKVIISSFNFMMAISTSRIEILVLFHQMNFSFDAFNFFLTFRWWSLRTKHTYTHTTTGQWQDTWKTISNQPDSLENRRKRTSASPEPVWTRWTQLQNISRICSDIITNQTNGSIWFSKS